MTSVCLVFACTVLTFHLGHCLIIQSASLGAGSDRGLLLVKMDNGVTGSVCMLNETKVGEAACTYMLGKANSTAVDLKMFNGSTSYSVVAALNGCAAYDAAQTGKWNLNNDCQVITGPSIPAHCSDRRIQLACELVDLKASSVEDEGLVLVGLTGQMGTVCATGAGMAEAEAICRSLGYKNPERGYPVAGRYKPDLSNPLENTTVEQLSCKPGDRLINCNWKSASNCFDASNRLAVACNPVPPTPKPMPSPSLVCYRQEARICFSNNAIDSTGELQLIYNATSISGCAISNDSLSAQVCLRVLNYATCAVVSGDTDLFTQYHLLLRFLGEKNAIGNYVRPPLNFDLFCRLAKETLATGQSLGPGFVTPTSATDGHSGGCAVVEIYKGLSGGNFTDGPISGGVEVGTILYAAVALRGAADLSNSWLVVNNCWATDGLHNASLVVNKCPRDSGIGLIPVNNTAMAVRFQAFLFNTSSGGIGTANMQLLCSTVVCRLGDPSDQCSRQCVNFFHHGGALSARDEAAQDVKRMVTVPAILTVYQAGNAGLVISQSATVVTLAVILSFMLCL